MFPGAHARIYRNEVGEPTGWDYPVDDAPEPMDDHFEEGFVYDVEDDDGSACKECKRMGELCDAHFAVEEATWD